MAEGSTRDEYEYAIPLADAKDILEKFCGSRIVHKTRYHVFWEGRLWEIDEFHGANQGLVIAEIELQTEDEAVTLPCWIGDEITGEARYANYALAQKPYTRW